MSIAENLDRIRGRIHEACHRAGRDPASVTLVAVSKTVPAERVREAIEAGATDLGENYVQEARAKIELLGSLPADGARRPVNEPGGAEQGNRPGQAVQWHFIGHLQRNKAKYVARLFDMVQSVDSLALARELDRRAGAASRRLPVLVEVNISDEETKFGTEEAGALELVRGIAPLDHLDVRGLMTMPPFFDDPKDSRPYFIKLRDLGERIRSEGIERVDLDELSMGMSSDFEVAIEEGATIVRVGTAIFGPRGGG